MMELLPDLPGTITGIKVHRAVPDVRRLLHEPGMFDELA